MSTEIEKNVSMTIPRQASLFPKRFQVLSGSMLKVIAICAMLIDHVAAFLLYDNKIVLFTLFGRSVGLYHIMRYVGRIAFPLFAFLVVEGYLHTSNKKKYGIHLLVFALISELPWNLVHTGDWTYSNQNIFFTLLLGYLAVCVFEHFRGKEQVLLLVAILCFSIVFDADYGLGGVCLILFLYVLREHALLQALFGICTLSNGWAVGLAFVPINLYNQKRGFIRGRLAKYAFYAVYPVHLFIFYLVKLILISH